MKSSDNIVELAAALVEFRGDLPKISKDAKGNYSKYATLDNIISTISPVLAKYGLTFVQPLTTTKEGVIAIETVVLHKSGQWISSVSPLSVEQNGRLAGAQAQGSATTYAKRYALCAALGISPDEDDDGAAASQSPSQAASQDFDWPAATKGKTYNVNFKQIRDDIKAAPTGLAVRQIFAKVPEKLRHFVEADCKKRISELEVANEPLN